MKEIFILRHAKSSWKDSYLSDFDRPLADRGIREAKKLCGFIKKNSFNIDKVICSKAKRALETFYLVADGFNFEIEKAENILKREGLSDKEKYVASYKIETLKEINQ